jgi:alpha-tubulin suppressor-like RCC1 family protein
MLAMRARIAPRLCLLLALGFAAPLTAAAQQGEGGRIAAGLSHVCALTSAGGVVCWGRNSLGQLGNGALPVSAQPLPVPVMGLTTGIEMLAMGWDHSCALATGGGVQCWGANDDGELGNGTTTASNFPVPVAGLASGVAAIAAGGNHSCALTTGGAVLCWGRNAQGQLGDGTTTASSVPVAVTGLSTGVAAIAAGGNHSCALTTGGGVQCWGGNQGGELGNGSTAGSSVPVAVTGLSTGVAAIVAGGNHSCALTTGGGMLCWGADTVGQLGNGPPLAASSVPVQVSGLTSGIAAIDASSDNTCALTAGGGVLCWGIHGHLSGAANVPVSVADWSTDVVEIAVGQGFVCVLTTGGAECIGDNPSGQLGQGTAGQSSVPVQVIGFGSGIAAITAGYDNSCALTTGGGVQCWGGNASGQLGIGTSGLASNVPVPVTGLSSGMAAITAGTLHICALSSGGGVLCWGANFNGQLGNGGTGQSNLPVPVTGLSSGVAMIAAGWHHTCALTTGGGVQCWGQNSSGQLGNGSTSNSSLPVPVTGLSTGVAAIAAGNLHTCALTTGGGVQCWGRNLDGQLGNGSTSNSSVPVAVTGLAGSVALITAGTLHTCVVTTVGGVQCWGRNDVGQLGDGTTANSSVPVSVPSLASGVAAVVAGTSFTCALTTSGGVQCWGGNGAGQLGDGTTVSSPVSVSVIGLAGGVSAIEAGSGHACAITTSGGALCWGSNLGFKLGDGYVSRSLVPLTVLGFGPAVIPVPTLGAPGLALLAALLATAARALLRRRL